MWEIFFGFIFVIMHQLIDGSLKVFKQEMVEELIVVKEALIFLNAARNRVTNIFYIMVSDSW